MPVENHFVTIYKIPINIKLVPTSHFRVNFSCIQKNQITHKNIADNLDATIALIAKVSLNHFIKNKGFKIPENKAIKNNAISAFLSRCHIFFNSGRSPKNNITAMTEKIWEIKINVSGIVNCKRYLLKILYVDPKNTESIAAIIHQRREDMKNIYLHFKT